MATLKKVRFEIVKGNGPSREDVRDSLGSRPHNPFLVKFEVKGGSNAFLLDEKLAAGESFTFICSIRMMEWEDGSGESFNIGGYARRIFAESMLDDLHKPFKGYYSTRRREAG